MRPTGFGIALMTCGTSLWLAVSGGCGSQGGIRTVKPDAASGGDTAVVEAEDATSCRTDKIAFSQATGCKNDGAVEFCLPASDDGALAQVASIDSTIVCVQGVHGRAGCDLKVGQLCQLPIPSTRCSMEDPMPDALWLTVCRLAALDAVAKIVPTWYE